MQSPSVEQANGRETGQSGAYDVIISGAGPVGLFLACELAMRRCSVLVLEKADSAQSELKELPFGLRGLNSISVDAFYRRGLFQEFELYKKMAGKIMGGAPKPTATTAGQDTKPPPQAQPQGPPKADGPSQGAGPPKAGGPPQGGAGFFGGVTSSVSPDVTQWKYRLPSSTESKLFTELREVETILHRRAAALGVEVKYGSAVTDLQQTADGVTVHAGEQSFHGKWLVGCDGSRSAVRKLGGFEYVGTPPEVTGYSTTVELAQGEKLKPGRVLTEQGLYWQLFPGYVIMQDFDGGKAHRPGEAVTRERVEEVLRRLSGTDVGVTKLHKASTWTDRCRQTTTYRNGRVLVAGDAAHIHSPLGGQGLNLGLGDAINLGWKLAATIQQRAPEGLLDTYYTERHPIGEQVLNWSRAQIATMKPDLTARALSGIIRDFINTRDGATYLAARLAGISTHYDMPGSHALVGYSVPNFELESGETVGELLHDGEGLLLDFGSTAALRQLASGYGERLKYVAGKAKEQKGVAAVLVRPDGIVAWASDSEGELDEQAVRQAAAPWFPQASDVQAAQSQQ